MLVLPSPYFFLPFFPRSIAFWPFSPLSLNRREEKNDHLRSRGVAYPSLLMGKKKKRPKGRNILGPTLNIRPKWTENFGAQATQEPILERSLEQPLITTIFSKPCNYTAQKLFLFSFLWPKHEARES